MKIKEYFVLWFYVKILLLLIRKLWELNGMDKLDYEYFNKKIKIIKKGKKNKY